MDLLDDGRQKISSFLAPEGGFIITSNCYLPV